jgi:hypothetical protein
MEHSTVLALQTLDDVDDYNPDIFLTIKIILSHKIQTWTSGRPDKKLMCFPIYRDTRRT